MTLNLFIYIIIFQILNLLKLVCVYCSTDYCNMSTCAPSKHVLCSYSNDGPSSSCFNYDTNSPISEKDINEILDRLNYIRNFVATGRTNNSFLPGAYNMNKLVWSSELSNFAQRWADQCILSGPTYGSFRDSCRDTTTMKVGQNIATVVDATPDLILKSLVDIWFMEALRFDGNVSYYRNPINDSRIEYFTQLIWANTEFVGCGRSKFSDKKTNKKVIRLVCNFGPRGNIQKMSVYEPFGSCQVGRKRDITYNRLCSRYEYQHQAWKVPKSTINIGPLLRSIKTDKLDKMVTKNSDYDGKITLLQNNGFKKIRQIFLNDTDYINDYYKIYELPKSETNTVTHQHKDYPYKILFDDNVSYRSSQNVTPANDYPTEVYDSYYEKDSKSYQTLNYFFKYPAIRANSQKSTNICTRNFKCSRNSAYFENNKQKSATIPMCSRNRNLEICALEVTSPYCPSCTHSQCDPGCKCSDLEISNICPKCFSRLKDPSYLSTTLVNCKQCPGLICTRLCGQHRKFNNNFKKSIKPEDSYTSTYRDVNYPDYDQTIPSITIHPFKHTHTGLDDKKIVNGRINKLSQPHLLLSHNYANLKKKRRNNVIDQNTTKIKDYIQNNNLPRKNKKSIQYPMLNSSAHSQNVRKKPSNLSRRKMTEKITIPVDEDWRRKNKKEKYLTFDELMSLRGMDEHRGVINANNTNFQQGYRRSNDNATTTAQTMSKIRKCTRKFTCTWTVSSSNGESGNDKGDGATGVDNSNDNHVDGCTRTSTCTRENKDKNKGTLDDNDDFEVYSRNDDDDDEIIQSHSVNDHNECVKRNIPEHSANEKIDDIVDYSMEERMRKRNVFTTKPMIKSTPCTCGGRNPHRHIRKINIGSNLKLTSNYTEKNL